MNIIRYQDSRGQVGFAAEQKDGTALNISSDSRSHTTGMATGEDATSTGFV